MISDGEDAETYAPVAVRAHLDTIANMLVDQALPLGCTSGWLLDTGMGSGRIPLKIACRFVNLRGVGISRSDSG